MSLSQAPKGHCFPISIISHAVWRYDCFNDSYLDISEELAYRGIIVSYEAIKIIFPVASSSENKELIFR